MRSTSVALSTFVLVLASLQLCQAATPPTDATVTRSSSGAGGTASVEDAGPVIDNDPTTSLRLRAGDTIEIPIEGGAPWVSEIEFVGGGGSVEVWTMGLDRKWRPAGRLDLTAADALPLAATRLQALRITPTGDGAVFLAEIVTTFRWEDPDRAAGDPPSLFGEWIGSFAQALGRWPDLRATELENTRADVGNMRTQMTQIGGWTADVWGQGQVWERDYRTPTEEQWIDNHDLSYLATHGLETGSTLHQNSEPEILFDVAKDATGFSPMWAANAWGTRDLEWATLQCCLLLKSPGDQSAFFGTMNGAHMILGWGTHVLDTECWGQHFGYNLRPDYRNPQTDPAVRVIDAWTRMYDKCASTRLRHSPRIIAETDTVLQIDHVWGAGPVAADPTHDTTFTLYQITSGRRWLRPAVRPSGELISVGSKGGCPEIRVSRSLLERAGDPPALHRFFLQEHDANSWHAAELAELICATSGLFCDAAVGTSKDSVGGTASDGPWHLRVSSGGSLCPEIFNDTLLVIGGDVPSLPSEEDAVAMANSLLDLWEINKPDQEAVQVSYNSIVHVDASDPAHPVVVDSMAVALNVHYQRRLFTGYPVSGPGASMVVTFGDGDQLMSLHRGAWRDPLPLSPPVPLISFSQATDALATHGLDAAIEPYISGNLSRIDVLDYELGYYEFGEWVPQSLLRPAYHMRVNFVTQLSDSSLSVEESEVSLFADQLPLIVKITSPAANDTVLAGEEICFEATVSGGIGPVLWHWDNQFSGIFGYEPQVCARFDVPNLGEKDGRDQLITVSVQDASLYVDSDAMNLFVLNPSAVIEAGPELGLSIRVQPSPVSGPTLVAFEVPRSGRAVLSLHDVQGRRVRTLVNGVVDAGVHQIRWDGRGENGKALAGGVYFCRIRCGRLMATEKIVVTR